MSAWITLAGTDLGSTMTGRTVTLPVEPSTVMSSPAKVGTASLTRSSAADAGTTEPTTCFWSTLVTTAWSGISPVVTARVNASTASKASFVGAKTVMVAVGSERSARIDGSAAPTAARRSESSGVLVAICGAGACATRQRGGFRAVGKVAGGQSVRASAIVGSCGSSLRAGSAIAEPQAEHETKPGEFAMQRSSETQVQCSALPDASPM